MRLHVRTHQQVKTSLWAKIAANLNLFHFSFFLHFPHLKCYSLEEEERSPQIRMQKRSVQNQIILKKRLNLDQSVPFCLQLLWWPSISVYSFSKYKAGQFWCCLRTKWYNSDISNLFSYVWYFKHNFFLHKAHWHSKDAICKHRHEQYFVQKTILMWAFPTVARQMLNQTTFVNDSFVTDDPTWFFPTVILFMQLCILVSWQFEE